MPSSPSTMVEKLVEEPVTIEKPLTAQRPREATKPVAPSRMSKLNVRLPSGLLITVSRHLGAWIMILLLTLLSAETIYVFSRSSDPTLERRIESRYPTPNGVFNQKAIDQLRSLTPQPAVPTAGGKANPFVP